MSTYEANRAEMESVLSKWGEEYGGGRYDDIGYAKRSTIAKLMEHRGFSPDSQIAKLVVPLGGLSDLVELCVAQLQSSGVDGFAEAHCLRIHYNNRKPRLKVVIEILNKSKNRVLRSLSEREYYRRLNTARERVAIDYLRRQNSARASVLRNLRRDRTA